MTAQRLTALAPLCVIAFLWLRWSHLTEAAARRKLASSRHRPIEIFLRAILPQWVIVGASGIIGIAGIVPLKAAPICVPVSAPPRT